MSHKPISGEAPAAQQQSLATEPGHDERGHERQPARERKHPRERKWRTHGGYTLAERRARPPRARSGAQGRRLSTVAAWDSIASLEGAPVPTCRSLKPTNVAPLRR